MWIMVAGPYSSGAKDEAERAANLAVMNEAAVAVFDKGHIPVIGVNMALPVIDAAGEDRYEEIMMPVSLALARRCDAVLRVGGASAGADDEVAVFESRGLPVFRDAAAVPPAVS
ncbi:MAG: DUF4406 domain-containing protein [Planctomycetota bacterium]